MRAESRVVEVEKQCSMLEFDLKQSVQKMEQLMKQKERLEDEVSNPSQFCSDFNEYIYFLALVCLVSVISYLSCVVLSPGEESKDTGRTGVEQTCSDSERPEEPHAGG